MEQTLNLTVNRLPALTWHHLGMNQTSLAQVLAEGEGTLTIEAPEGVSQPSEDDLPAIGGGMGPDVDTLVQAAGVPVHHFNLSAGTVASQPVRVKLTYGPEDKKINAFTIHAEAESQVTVLMDYAGDADGEGLAAIQTKIYAEEGALVRLVQVQRLPKGFTCLNDVGGLCENGAKIEVTHLVLGGHATYQGCQIDLTGHDSALETDIGYLLESGSKLDMNYNAIHRGKKTTSRIDASGVLKEEAFKLFRGTIDFKHGSAGSVGNEKEDVLLLDDTAINQTIPLILCAEEDVQGNHGATIGKLSEETLAYMAARGIPEETAYELMAKARIHRVCERIPDEATRQLVEQELEGGNEDE